MSKPTIPSLPSLLLLAGTLCVGLGGCDPEVEDLGDVDELEVTNEHAELREVEYEVIAEVVTDDGATLVFTREPISEGSEEYTVGTKMIGSVGGIDYGRLILEQDLTPLEVFLAFAPAGAEPPEELRVIHEATVDFQGRETDELRRLIVPRAITVSANHPNCDTYSDFTDAVDATWSASFPREQATSLAGGNHSVSKSGWHSAYGMACNSAYGSADQKLVSMCRKQPSDPAWSCESTTLDDAEYGWKTWSTVGSGGAYTSFNFQLNGMMVGGVSTSSYLGLVVVAAIG